MFIHNFTYCLKTIFRGKVTLFWTLIFPIILGSCMYLAFGKISETEEMFKDVKVAVVESEANEYFDTFLEAVSGKENHLFDVEKMDENTAKEQLDSELVVAIVYSKDCSMLAKNNNYKTAVVESVLKQYKQNEAIYKDIIAENPQNAYELLGEMTVRENFIKETKTSNGNQNVYNAYFFAIFAMSCLFASFSSVYTTSNMQGNVSTLGMRRNIVPTSKMVTVISEFAALLLIHFVVELIALAYFTMIGIDFGNKYPAIVITLLVGCMIGIAIGMIIGCITKVSVDGKIGIAVSIGMVMSVMADLCVPGIKYTLQRNAPIVNKINPAALISDCFYALNAYDDYARFTENIIILVCESVLLIIICCLMLRRNKYASV